MACTASLVPTVPPPAFLSHRFFIPSISQRAVFGDDLVVTTASKFMSTTRSKQVITIYQKERFHSNQLTGPGTYFNPNTFKGKNRSSHRCSRHRKRRILPQVVQVVVFSLVLVFVNLATFSVTPGELSNISFAATPVSDILPRSSIYVATKDTQLSDSGGMACVASKCTSELSACLYNSKCAKGLRCFVQCSMMDSTNRGMSLFASARDRTETCLDEGSCQSRCMDLYQGPLLDKFTDCTLTRHQCYPSLKADTRYPPIRSSDRKALWQEDLVVPDGISSDSASYLERSINTVGAATEKAEVESQLLAVATKLKTLFKGRWYVAAGLNPVFDTFDCQIHHFYEADKSPYEDGNEAAAAGEPRAGNDKSAIVVTDATFSYRVKTGTKQDEWFTRNADKRLTLDVPRNCDYQSLDKEGMGSLQFDYAKKWGKDCFQINNDKMGGFITKNWPTKNWRNIESDLRGDRYERWEFSPRLQLNLRPAQMNYSDEWVVLSSSTDPVYGYIVLLYRGSNSAWDGYGGLNVYTRTGFLPVSGGDEEVPDQKIKMRYEIAAGLRKVGLNLDDLVTVDNTCSGTGKGR